MTPLSEARVFNLFLFFLLWCVPPNQSWAPQADRVVESLLQSARKGDAKSQLQLAALYQNGEGVKKDEIQAAKWYTASAEQGNAWGQYCLGISYRDGSGVPKDEQKAVEWFLKAAEQGHVDAMFNVAKAYQNGKGVDQDSLESFRWYQKAADLGDVESQSIVGWCFATGLGTPKNMKQALFWTRKAAEQGNLHAQLNLAECYKNGEEGLMKDPKLAVKWYALAAAQEDPDGQYNLGSFYETGFGVANDEKTALEWYSKAALNGHVQAKEKILLIKKVKQPETAKAVRLKSPNENRGGQEPRTFSNNFVKTATKGINPSGYIDAGYSYNFASPGDPQISDSRDFQKGDFNLYAVKASLENALAQEKKARALPKDCQPDMANITLLAQKGDAESQYLLGCYYEEKGPQNINEAAAWYSRSAEQGHEGANEKLRSLKRKEGGE